MEVSEKTEQVGEDLLDTVVSLTGLPQEDVQAELRTWIESAGMKPSDITLDELRAAMIAYLESMQADIQAEEQAFLESTNVELN